jgi:hypothetical protein
MVHPLIETHSSATLANTEFLFPLILMFFKQREPPSNQPMERENQVFVSVEFSIIGRLGSAIAALTEAADVHDGSCIGSDGRRATVLGKRLAFQATISIVLGGAEARVASEVAACMACADCRSQSGLRLG